MTWPEIDEHAWLVLCHTGRQTGSQTGSQTGGISGNKITVLPARSCCMLWFNRGDCCATVLSYCDKSWDMPPHLEFCGGKCPPCLPPLPPPLVLIITSQFMETRLQDRLKNNKNMWGNLTFEKATSESGVATGFPSSENTSSLIIALYVS